MAVAGSFYPAGAGQLATTVDELLSAARAAFPPPAGLDPPAARRRPRPARRPRLLGSRGGGRVAGARCPSGRAGPVVAAPARSRRPARAEPPPTIVLLGTNHGAAWLDGVGAWDGGPWRTPLGEVEIDRELTDAVVALGAPFAADARCHLGEHSLEVQLPFVRRLAPGARIVALSVGTGTGARAIEAGERLGGLLAARRTAGQDVVLAISSDMAHYPAAGVAERVTAALLPSIVSLDSAGLARAEAATRREPGVSCGMCGIEPTVLGLAALRAMGAAPGVPLAAATSADAGGDPRRTVGYLAVGVHGLSPGLGAPRCVGPRGECASSALSRRVPPASGLGGRPPQSWRISASWGPRTGPSGGRGLRVPESRSGSPSASSGRGRRERRGRRGRPGSPSACPPAALGRALEGEVGAEEPDEQAEDDPAEVDDLHGVRSVAAAASPGPIGGLAPRSATASKARPLRRPWLGDAWRRRHGASAVAVAHRVHRRSAAPGGSATGRLRRTRRASALPSPGNRAANRGASSATRLRLRLVPRRIHAPETVQPGSLARTAASFSSNDRNAAPTSSRRSQTSTTAASRRSGSRQEDVDHAAGSLPASPASRARATSRRRAARSTTALWRRRCSMSRGRLAPDTARGTPRAGRRRPPRPTAHSSIGAFAPSPRSSSLHLAWLILARAAASAWVIAAATRASLSPTPRRTATASARPRPRITSWVARAVARGSGARRFPASARRDRGRGGSRASAARGALGASAYCPHHSQTGFTPTYRGSGGRPEALEAGHGGPVVARGERGTRRGSTVESGLSRVAEGVDPRPGTLPANAGGSERDDWRSAGGTRRRSWPQRAAGAGRRGNGAPRRAGAAEPGAEAGAAGAGAAGRSGSRPARRPAPGTSPQNASR